MRSGSIVVLLSSVAVRSNILVALACVLGLFGFVAGSSSFVSDFFLLFNHFLGHFVHVVAVDFCEMGRSSVLQSVDG